MTKLKHVADVVTKVVVPRSILGGLLRVLVIVIIVGGVVGGLAWKSSVDKVKKDSNVVLARATHTVALARKAYVSGAADKTQFQEAITSLQKANTSYDKGSYFNRSSYKQAGSYATESITAAKTIISWRRHADTIKSDATDDVSTAQTDLAAAQPAAPGNAWEKSRVDEAAVALTDAEASLASGSYSNLAGYTQAKDSALTSDALSHKQSRLA